MAEPKYKRVLIKLSGEALAGERGVGIDLPTVQAMAKEIAEVADSGIQIALVIGGGNLWRGDRCPVPSSPAAAARHRRPTRPDGSASPPASSPEIGRASCRERV